MENKKVVEEFVLVLDDLNVFSINELKGLKRMVMDSYGRKDEIDKEDEIELMDSYLKIDNNIGRRIYEGWKYSKDRERLMMNNYDDSLIDDDYKIDYEDEKYNMELWEGKRNWLKKLDYRSFMVNERLIEERRSNKKGLVVKSDEVGI